MTRQSFANYTAAARELFIERMTSTIPTEVVSFKEVMSHALGHENSSMEAITPITTAPSSLRPKNPPSKKLMPVRQSPRKTPELRQKEKKDKQPEKVVDFGEAEYQDVEDLYVEEVETITWILAYIHPQKGKRKVTKDLDSEKFMVSTPLLLEHVEF